MRISELGERSGFVTGLAQLCVAETACCPLFTFRLDISSTAVVRTVAGHEEMTGRLFEANVTSGAPTSRTPDRGRTRRRAGRHGDTRTTPARLTSRVAG